jgi:hypothetical protein
LKIPTFELPSRRASSAGWAQSGAPFLLVVVLVGCLGSDLREWSGSENQIQNLDRESDEGRPR